MAASQDIIGLSRSELTGELLGLGFDAGLIKSLWTGIYAKGATCFDEMQVISRARRELLGEHFLLRRPSILREQVSADGTRKWLLEFRGDEGTDPESSERQSVEAVLIPQEDRGALCVSSQAGCSLSCSFCHTGTMKLARNLTVSEIVNQVLAARDRLGEWGKKRREYLLTNLVLMGMGEPLFNYENVSKALRIIMDPEGIAISRRRIMLSTAGVVPMIERLGRELGVNLAVSLHAVRDELRDELVPLNRKYPLRELMRACREYPGLRNSRRITFEYVMLRGVNDSDAEARELVRLLEGIPAKVNLIPWNPWPGGGYEPSLPERIGAFARIVNDAGYSSAVRATRGEDIMAACGQLKSDEVGRGERVGSAVWD